MPRRVVLELVGQVLGIQLSLGSVQNSWEGKTSEAVAEPCAELERQLPKQVVINSDAKPDIGPTEKNAGFGLWLHPALSFIRSRFRGGPKCWFSCLGQRLRESSASDRCPSYLKYHKGSAQFCWAHFKRNVLGALEIAKTTDAGEVLPRSAGIARAPFPVVASSFRDGPSAKHGPIDRQQLILKSIPLEKKFFALADRYADSGDKDVRNLATALLMHFERFSSPFSIKRVWSRPITLRNARCGAPCSGAKSVLEAAWRGR